MLVWPLRRIGSVLLSGRHLTHGICRDYSEGKHEAKRAELAMREAVAKDQTYARKVYYALNRWHVSWQLMDSFQHWVAAMRLRRVRCLLHSLSNNLDDQAYGCSPSRSSVLQHLTYRRQTWGGQVSAGTLLNAQAMSKASCRTLLAGG